MAIQGRQKMEVEKLFVKIHLYDILDDAKWTEWCWWVE
jgi:hypothetical protein